MGANRGHGPLLQVESGVMLLGYRRITCSRFAPYG